MKIKKKPVKKARPPVWHMISFDGERIPYLDNVRLKGVKTYRITVESDGMATLSLDMFVRMGRKR